VQTAPTWMYYSCYSSSCPRLPVLELWIAEKKTAVQGRVTDWLTVHSANDVVVIISVAHMFGVITAHMT